MDQNGHGRSRYANSSKRSNGTHNGPFMYKVINVVMKATTIGRPTFLARKSTEDQKDSEW